MLTNFREMLKIFFTNLTEIFSGNLDQSKNVFKEILENVFVNLEETAVKFFKIEADFSVISQLTVCNYPLLIRMALLVQIRGLVRRR